MCASVHKKIILAVLAMPATMDVSKPHDMPVRLATMTARLCAAPPMDCTSMAALRVNACRKSGKKGTVECQRCHTGSPRADMRKRLICGLALCALWESITVCPALSSGPPTANFGPYNAAFLDGGVGLTRALSGQAAPLAAQAPWSMAGWLRMAHRQPGQVIVCAVGDIAGEKWWGLAVRDGSLSLVVGSTTLRGGAALEAGRWYALAAVFDGAAAHLYLDGREVAVQPLSTPRVRPSLELAPTTASSADRAHFGG